MANTKYHDGFPKMAEQFAGDGLSDRCIADHLGISSPTLYAYKKDHPEFDDAIRRGRDFATQKLELTLYDLAMGRCVSTTSIVDGDREIIKTHTLPPNLRAMMILLRKNAPEEWAEPKNIATPPTPTEKPPKPEKPAEVKFGSPEAIEMCRKMAEEAEIDLFKDCPADEIPEETILLMQRYGIPIKPANNCQPEPQNDAADAAPVADPDPAPTTASPYPAPRRAARPTASAPLSWNGLEYDANPDKLLYKRC